MSLARAYGDAFENLVILRRGTWWLEPLRLNVEAEEGALLGLFVGNVASKQALELARGGTAEAARRQRPRCASMRHQAPPAHGPARMRSSSGCHLIAA